MTYRQNSTARSCAICRKPILPDEWMLDLFRAAQVQWVHENCARVAIEIWLIKKQKTETPEAIPGYTVSSGSTATKE